VLARGLLELERVREGQRERLLGENVPLGAQAGEGDLGVASRGREVDDEIDQPVRKHLVERRVDPAVRLRQVTNRSGPRLRWTKNESSRSLNQGTSGRRSDV
jgi:hypothetical protein